MFLIFFNKINIPNLFFLVILFHFLINLFLIKFCDKNDIFLLMDQGRNVLRYKNVF